MYYINQNQKVGLVITKKTVDWLVHNTEVRVFNPITFTGYQRQINEKHCEKIVDFLRQDFFLPTAIICAVSEKYAEDKRLRVVDGQHRIHAFRILQNKFLARYNEIKDYEIPVIVMEEADENLEIDTFITINKTSKKVDTSLAFVLKNKINKYASSSDMSMPKAEYLSVELALRLNDESRNDIWSDKIIYEGNPKNTDQLISLNAFVKSTRSLINNLAKKNILSMNWSSPEDIDKCIDICDEIICAIWESLTIKWPQLFYGSLENRRIIQGAIGYSAINKVVNKILEEQHNFTLDSATQLIRRRLKSITCDADMWLPGGIFSQFTSESGYSFVASEIYKTIK